MGKKQILTCPSWTFNPTLLGANGTIAAGTFTGQYHISNNVTISGNVNLLNAEVLIDPQVTITVLAGGVLRIDHSHLFGCTNKWDRIWVKDGGQIFVTNNSLIEDAYIAIYTTFVPSATNIPPAVIDARNSMFNKNAYGIFISQFYNNSGNYPYTITNCVFTSRKLPSLLLSGLTTNGLKTLSNTGVLEPPYINNSLYQPTFPLGSSIYPNAGITLQHIGTTTNVNLASPNNTPVYHELEIGSSIAQEFNLFDNLQVGIDMLNTNLTCHNAVFQNTVVQGGIGIRANALKDRNTRCRLIPAMNGTNPINGTHNRFYNCKRGIESKDYFEMQVERASFRSMQIFAGILSSAIGEYGYRGTSNRFHLYNINRDTFFNIGNPVAFFGTHSNTPFAGTINITQYNGDINVNENFIRPHPNLSLINNQYISNAITVSNTPGTVNGVATTIAGGNSIYVFQNLIHETYRGINIENWSEKWEYVRSNDITLRIQAPLGADIPVQYGIRFVNNTGQPTGNNTAVRFLVDNDILGFGLSFPNILGMIHSGNNFLEVRCNHVSDTEKGIQFINGASSFTTFWDNTMEKNRYGYTLENNCQINNQGTLINPSDNRWLGAWVAPNFMTYVANSFALASTLFVRNAATYNPDGFGASAGVFPYAFAFGINYITNNPTQRSCPPSSIATATSSINLLEAIATAEIPYYCNTEVAQFMNEYDLYTLLENEPRWRDSSAILDSFYLAHRSLVFGQLYEIDTTIVAADWQAAQNLISNFYPVSAVEDNYKNYYTWYVKIQTDSTGLTTDENSALYNLAISCVGDGGKVVQYAQTLYNFYNDTLAVFVDTCVCNGAESRLISPNLATLFSITPNPTSDKIHLLVNQQGDFIVEIRDIQGKIIEMSQHQAVERDVIFKNRLTAGIYFIHLTNTLSHEQQTQKVIIY